MDSRFFHPVQQIVYVALIVFLCINYTACRQGDIRLIGGADDREGRMEVCNQNQWGSVCDVSWDMNDANVACRQAGFGSGNLNILMTMQKSRFLSKIAVHTILMWTESRSAT